MFVFVVDKLHIYNSIKQKIFKYIQQNWVFQKWTKIVQKWTVWIKTKNVCLSQTIELTWIYSTLCLVNSNLKNMYLYIQTIWCKPGHSGIYQCKYMKKTTALFLDWSPVFKVPLEEVWADQVLLHNLSSSSFVKLYTKLG